MKIRALETFLIGRSWNNLLFVRLTTDGGLTGVGEGTMQWQASTVAEATRLLFDRYVVGSSPLQIERLVQAMYRSEYARGGPVLNSAIAGIEMALWDICGKALGQPVHTLLGGKVRDSVPAYANGWYRHGVDDAAVAADARATAETGFGGMKFDPFMGCGRDPAPATLRRGFEILGVVRDAVGPDVRILVDGHGRFSVGTASYVAHGLAEHDVYWFEEPVDPENYQALGEVARPGGLRIATGERCFSRYQYPGLISIGRPHVLQPDLIQVGGLLEARKIAAIADSHYLTVSLHTPFGPISTAASLHLDAATTNFVSQESFSAFDVPWRSDLVTNCPMPKDGAYAVSDAPGLGIELNIDAINAHPYRPEALAPTYDENGSMTAWLDHA
jgi:galactonate dehydratase